MTTTTTRPKHYTDRLPSQTPGDIFFDPYSAPSETAAKTDDFGDQVVACLKARAEGKLMPTLGAPKKQPRKTGEDFGDQVVAALEAQKAAAHPKDPAFAAKVVAARKRLRAQGLLTEEGAFQ